eukprot:9065712-Pyramimonas_sp.AAC.1
MLLMRRRYGSWLRPLTAPPEPDDGAERHGSKGKPRVGIANENACSAIVSLVGCVEKTNQTQKTFSGYHPGREAGDREP